MYLKKHRAFTPRIVQTSVLHATKIVQRKWSREFKEIIIQGMDGAQVCGCLSLIRLCLDTVVSRTILLLAPKVVYVLVLRTREYVTLHSKWPWQM